MPAIVIGILSSIGFFGKARAERRRWWRSARDSPRAGSARSRRRAAPDRRSSAIAARCRSRGSGRGPRRRRAGSRRSPRAGRRRNGARRSGHRQYSRGVVDVEIIEAPGRAIAAETGRVGGDPGALEQRRRRAATCVGSSPSRCNRRRGSRPCRRQRSRLHRCESPRSCPASPQTTSVPAWPMKALIWPTEPPTTMSTPFIEMPQRALASPSMTTQPAASRGGRRLRGVAAHPHAPAHDVLGDAGAGMAVDRDSRRRVHAGAVIADMAVDLDVDRRGEPDRDRVRAVRVHAPATAARWCPGASRCRRSFRSRTELCRQVDLDHGPVTGAARNRRSPGAAPRSRRRPRRAGSRSRGTRSPWRPNRRSRPGPRACRRSGRAGSRSRRACRRRRCRTRRDRRARPRAPPVRLSPWRRRQVSSRRRPRCRCRSRNWMPSRRRLRRSRLWFDSEPLCTRQRSIPVENGCECSVVTALSVAIRVWPSAWVPAVASRPKRRITASGRPTSLNTSMRSPNPKMATSGRCRASQARRSSCIGGET